MITHLISVSPARTGCFSAGSPGVITQRTGCGGQGGREETGSHPAGGGTDGWTHMKNILFISTQTAKAHLLWLSNWLTNMHTVPLFSVTVEAGGGGLITQRLLKGLSPSSQRNTLQSWKGTKNYTNNIVYNILSGEIISAVCVYVCVF